MSEHPELSDGYGKIANEIMDALSATYMSSYESQFLWCLFRHTYGWSKKDDLITLSEVAASTGMHLSHVSRTKKKLLHRKIVTQTGNKIAFNKYYSQWVRLPKQVMLPKQVTKKTPAHLGKSPPPVQVSDPPPVQVTTPYKENKKKDVKESGAKIAPTPSQIASEFFGRGDAMATEAKYWIEEKGVPLEIARAEFEKFCAYWTEKNKSGTKERWQLQSTFEVRRRLATWFSNIVASIEKKGGSLTIPDMRT